MDCAGQREVRAHVVSKGLRGIYAGPRRRTGEHKDQVARADGGGDAAGTNCRPTACEARSAGNRAGEKQLPAAWRSIFAVRMHVQSRRWPAVTNRRAERRCEDAKSQKGGNCDAGGEM